MTSPSTYELVYESEKKIKILKEKDIILKPVTQKLKLKI